MRREPLRTTTVHRGAVGEMGSLYTRLLVTDADGPNAGAILLTWELRLGVADDGGPSFPIWRSLDGGHSWATLSEVPDLRYGYGNRYQPMLYELPADIAHLRRGDLLLAGNAIPADGSSTHLVLYSSSDGGRTWAYESTVDSGGPAIYSPRSDAATTAVWEPDLHLIEGVLHCFFADEREKDRGMLQVIARRSSTDLRTWSEKDLISGVGDRFHRPGMFVGTGEMPDGVHRAVIEVVGPAEVPVHLLTSRDGTDWGDPAAVGLPLRAEDGVAISGTPTIAWRERADGAVEMIATGRHSLRDGVAGNRALRSLDLGATWTSFELPTPAERLLTGDGSGYSQSVRWNADGDLVHATTVRSATGSHDVVVSVALAGSAGPRDQHAR
ncbi:sialidase family protein [Ruania halotolerans]|uniref:sialidase family protein n=1 Tax=Ruania halotolerans TaxID=2897773 RepID=UPI001E3B1327|nr:sialidase family protein [Ruania halotolerans]UFU06659.1 glycoside hydrolase [Ruania halotolerans]